MNTTKMTVGMLKKVLSSIPDDFEFEIEVERKLKPEELDPSYPYPIDSERFNIGDKDYDIGWSDKKMKLNVDATYMFGKRK